MEPKCLAVTEGMVYFGYFYLFWIPGGKSHALILILLQEFNDTTAQTMYYYMVISRNIGCYNINIHMYVSQTIWPAYYSKYGINVIHHGTPTNQTLHNWKHFLKLLFRQVIIRP